jgi:hypothetical protein
VTNDEYQAETIRRALAGDAEAGREALGLCRDGLNLNRLSIAMQAYLCDRLTDVLDGVPPAKALCVAKERGRPKDPFPKWQEHLGAFAALLAIRGYKPAQIADAMCVQRSKLHNLNLDQSDAYRIQAAWAGLREWDYDYALGLVGPYWEVLSEYPPLT